MFFVKRNAHAVTLRGFVNFACRLMSTTYVMVGDFLAFTTNVQAVFLTSSSLSGVAITFFFGGHLSSSSDSHWGLFLHSALSLSFEGGVPLEPIKVVFTWAVTPIFFV